ncbi:Hypothetical protein CINCED_3A016013 [Cinara cedri]|uniref:Uncharacterized protein n=1 Tax=Cinara cedri TaxID=506608 RepID=A0A5E4N5X3_9HEMI|nr:Hypothetical protein CINCED_3A016013 [Cinara cedri]
MIRKYITRQRSVSWPKIIIASGLGVLGGVYIWKPFFESLDSERPQKTKPGGNLRSNFNKILAVVGIGWLASMVIVRYVIKPWKLETRMKQNEAIMNQLYDEQVQQEMEKEILDI